MMRKTLLCNLDLLRTRFIGYGEDEIHVLEDLRIEFLELLDAFLQCQEDDVVFYSMDQSSLRMVQDFFDTEQKEYRFTTREQVNRLLQGGLNSTYVIISGKNVDLQLAVRSKVLLVVPAWIPIEEKAARYGIVVDAPRQLFMFLQVLNNHNYWYSQARIDDHTWTLSLMDARYKYYAGTNSEREMMQNFEILLKQGRNRDYYTILLYHFLAGITNTDFFDDIELFGMIPSSDCTLNPAIFYFMQQVRYIKGKRLPHNHMDCDNIIMRVIPKEKAHETSGLLRKQTGPEIEFSTICLNPEFSKKIGNLKKEGRFNVCIFDDYMTYGNSFNAVRNLLNHIGANKIVFVSLGTFGRLFEKWDYEIQGNVFDTGYDFRLIKKDQIRQNFNFDAKEEVAELYNIFNDE